MSSNTEPDLTVRAGLCDWDMISASVILRIIQSYFPLRPMMINGKVDKNEVVPA